jgi:hypothetical protein
MTRRGSIVGLALILALALPLTSAAQATQKPTQKPATPQPAAQSQKAPAAPAAQAPKALAPAATEKKPGGPAAPAQNQKPSAPATPAPASQPALTSAQDAYSYRAEGRRDPFVSLLNRGSDPRAQRKAEGLAGSMAADAMLKGILMSRGTYVAIVQVPNEKRQLIVRANDRFADGVIKAITADSMLILQEVNDPLSLTKQREIRKTLRAVEEVK